MVPVLVLLAMRGGVSAGTAERQRIQGHLPACAQNLVPKDRLDGSRRLHLAVGLPARNREGLDELVRQLYDPSSPRYRRFLTLEAFTAAFGPSEEDCQAVAACLRSNGLTVTRIHPNRLILEVEGPVRAIEQAFQVNMRVYPHPTEKRDFFAPDVEPSLDIRVPVLHVGGLDDSRPPRPMHRMRKLPASSGAIPHAGSGPSGTYRGYDFRTAYVPNTSLTGAGQSVGLLQFDGYYASDIATYRSLCGLPDVPLVNVAVNGGVASPGANNGEVALDIELTIAMAPGLSSVIVYEAPNATPWATILSRMSTDNLAKQFSCSWGGGGADPASETIFLQMAALGQSFFNATGDTDAFVGAVPFPSDSTNITQVGATTLTTASSGGAYVSETVWNAGSGIGTSGGSSTVYRIPGYQVGVSMASNQGSTTMRNVPDVAIVGDRVFVVIDNGTWGSASGASCAAPLWASFCALVNEQAATNGMPPVGFLNPALYALGKGANYNSVFHDITTGNNFSPSSPSKYSATTGYDLCTGWGTPNGTNLIAALTQGTIGLSWIRSSCTDVPGGNGNGTLDPGETLQESVVWTNTGTLAVSNITATLSAGAPGITMTQAQSAYPALPPRGSGTNTTPFAYRLSKNVLPGSLILFTNVLSASGQSFTGVFTRMVGRVAPMVTNIFSVTNQAGILIPVNTTRLVTNLVSMAGTNWIDDVNAGARISHSRDSYLVVALRHPDATEVVLANAVGGTGSNLGTGFPPATVVQTRFDDAAATPIASGTAPFAGTYRPSGVLSNLNGKTVNGAWKLRITNNSATRKGTNYVFSIQIVSHPSQYVATVYNTVPVASNALVIAAPGMATNLFLRGSDADGDAISFRTNSLPLHGALSGFDTNSGAITYTAAAGYTGTDSFTFAAQDGRTTSTAATVTFAVARQAQTIDFSAIPAQIATNTVRLSATATSGFAVRFAVTNGPGILTSGTNLTFTGTGWVSVAASQTGDVSWAPAPEVTNTFQVSKAAATVTLLNLTQYFDGAPRTVGATTAPPGLIVTITYDGQTGAPTAVGNYAVLGIVIDARYQGAQSGTLTIFAPRSSTLLMLR